MTHPMTDQIIAGVREAAEAPSEIELHQMVEKEAAALMLRVVNRWHEEVGIEQVLKSRLTLKIADVVASGVFEGALADLIRRRAVADARLSSAEDALGQAAEQIDLMRESALHQELQRVMAMHNTTIAAFDMQNRALALVEKRADTLSEQVKSLTEALERHATQIERQVKAADGYADGDASPNEMRPTVWEIQNSHFTDIAREMRRDLARAALSTLPPHAKE